ncbi:IS3 family transposase [Parablautia muri]|uniref:IS3 family transposase n=1 Tax=Parablautia muri TaxID=2320879 RepID=UPI002ED69677
MFQAAESEEKRLKEEGKRRLNVSGVLRILGVSRSGYNAFRKHTPSAGQMKREQRMAEIGTIYEESHEIYGAPKIAAKMRQKGGNVSGRSVWKYMREMEIRACYRKHKTRTTRDSDFSSGLKNILNRDFQPQRPDAAWCTDITYLWTCEGFVYLASIMDLYSRKIISWTLGETLETKWVLDAVEKAKAERRVTQPLVIHSDRGVQYTCRDYGEATKGMERRYSAKACPWDNACIESFHSLIKREWLSWFRITDYSHAYRLVFEYIEAFYNTVRIHSHCGYRSPGKYE